MSFTNPAAPAVTVKGANDTVHTADLVDVANAGDLILVFWATDGSGGANFEVPAGWNQGFVDELNSGGNNAGLRWKIAEAGDIAGAQAFTTSSSEESVIHVYVIPAGEFDPDDPLSVQRAEGSSATPDPPTLTPGPGSAAYLWFAAYGKDDDDVSTAGPAGYSGHTATFSSTGSGTCGLATAWRNPGTAVATEDPGTFSGGGADTWVAWTLAIHPAPAGGGGVTGAADSTLPALVQDAVGDVLVDGAADATLPALAQDAAGTVVDNSVAGDAAQTLPTLAADASGALHVDGAAASTLPALGQDAAGALSVDGAATSDLPALAQDAAGAALVDGPAAQVLPALAQDASGSVVEAGTVSGAAAQTLPGLTQDAAGEALVSGSADSGLPALTQSADGALAVTGAAGGTLGALATAAGGTLTVAGDGAAVLPGLATDAAGDVTAGDLADLAQLTLAAVAKHELTLAAAPLRLLTLTAELKALTVAADAGPTLTLAATHKNTLELEASIP